MSVCEVPGSRCSAAEGAGGPGLCVRQTGRLVSASAGRSSHSPGPGGVRGDEEGSWTMLASGTSQLTSRNGKSTHILHSSRSTDDKSVVRSTDDKRQ